MACVISDVERVPRLVDELPGWGEEAKMGCIAGSARLAGLRRAGGWAPAFGRDWSQNSPKRRLSLPNRLEIAGAGESYTSGSLMRAGDAGAGGQIQEMAIG